MKTRTKLPFSSPLRGRRLSARTVAVVGLGVVAAGAAALAIRPVSVHASLSGRPVVVDGDTLDFRDAPRARIIGIDAPELDQTCRDAANGSWACGNEARLALRVLVGTNGVQCEGDRLDRYGRVLVVCTGASGDIGAAMVRSGMAVASGRYFAEEAAARTAKAGVWAGSFETPRAWRDRAQGFDLWGWIMSWFGG